MINENPLPPEREIVIGEAYDLENALGHLNVYRWNWSVERYQIEKDIISYIKIETEYSSASGTFQAFFGYGWYDPSLNAYASWLPKKWVTTNEEGLMSLIYWTTDGTVNGEPLSAEQMTLLRTIELNEPATGDLLTWLQANAVKQ